MGLQVNSGIISGVISIIPTALFSIWAGLLAGSVLGIKQVGGLCETLLKNNTVWLSGIWFDLDIVGSFFATLSNILPFTYGVKIERMMYAGNYKGIAEHFV